MQTTTIKYGLRIEKRDTDQPSGLSDLLFILFLVAQHRGLLRLDLLAGFQSAAIAHYHHLSFFQARHNFSIIFGLKAKRDTPALNLVRRSHYVNDSLVSLMADGLERHDQRIWP